MTDQQSTEFASVLLNHAKGRAHDEASAKLREAVEAVQQLGKVAKVTVELSVHPVPNNSAVVSLQDKVTASIPTEKRASIWFPDDDGALHRNDPNQRELWEDERTPADGKTAAAGPNN
jgi:hypothetical protein